jgi:hypothetical protein
MVIEVEKLRSERKRLSHDLALRIIEGYAGGKLFVLPFAAIITGTLGVIYWPVPTLVEAMPLPNTILFCLSPSGAERLGGGPLAVLRLQAYCIGQFLYWWKSCLSPTLFYFVQILVERRDQEEGQWLCSRL